MALHRIAVTQIRIDGLGQVYYRKRLAEGDSRAHALRSLKRRVVRWLMAAMAPCHADAILPGRGPPAPTYTAAPRCGDPTRLAHSGPQLVTSDVLCARPAGHQ